MSLRTRLALGIGAVLVALVIAMLTVVRIERDYMIGQLDRQLRTVPPQVAFFPMPAPPTADALQSQPESPISNLFIGRVGPDGVLVEVMTGRLLDDIPDVSLARAQAQSHSHRGFSVEGRNHLTRFRVLSFPRTDGQAWGIIAVPEEETDAAIARLVRTLGVAAGLIMATLVLMGWWMVRLGLHPIARVTGAADAITAGQHRHRVDLVDPRTEAGRLGRAFNVMLDDRDEIEARLRQFVADASHELRTPLTSIRGYLDLYSQGGFRAEGELDEVVRRMRGEARRMDELVEDLLLLANLDQSRPLVQDPVDLADVLRDAADDGRAVQPGRTITVDLAPHPVGEGAELVVRGDERRLRQVIAELVHNALVHTAADAAIHLHGERTDGHVVVRVADTGAGLEPDMAAHVFDRFTRGDPSRSRSAGGSGLGLAIVRSIIEAHRGTISLSTEPGRGCDLRIELPG